MPWFALRDLDSNFWPIKYNVFGGSQEKTVYIHTYAYMQNICTYISAQLYINTYSCGTHSVCLFIYTLLSFVENFLTSSCPKGGPVLNCRKHYHQ